MAQYTCFSTNAFGRRTQSNTVYNVNLRTPCTYCAYTLCAQIENFKCSADRYLQNEQLTRTPALLLFYRLQISVYGTFSTIPAFVLKLRSTRYRGLKVPIA